MNQTRKRTEHGRSMVEMLGVLAIVGVLSVGGVYGYGVAMKKHKANELLHQASMQAVQIANQIATGKESGFGLENFGTTNGTFNQPSYDKSTGKFTMKITGMDSAVCEQMGNMAGGVLRDATCDGTTLTLTYYGNLATNDTDGQAGISGGGTQEATLVKECTTGTDIDSYYYSGDSTNEKTEAGVCHCPTDKPQWDGKECKSADTDELCTSHTEQQCPEGYYCHFSNPDNHTSGNGICTKITGASQKDGHWVGPILDWWSASSWCISKKTTLISNSTLVSKYGCGGYSCDWNTLSAVGLTGEYWCEDIIAVTYNSEYTTSIPKDAGLRPLCE